LLGTDLQTARECSGRSLKGRVPAGRYDTLCHILSALGDKKSFDEAAAKLLSICANDAEKVRYNCFLSTMLLRMNVPAEAWQKIEIAGKIDPERLEVCKAKAEYFIYMKELAKAEKCIEAALGKTSAVREIAEINYLRARLHAAKGEFQSAVEYMEAVEERMNTGFLEIQPFFFSYAEYLIKCGRYREARRKLEKIRPICNDMARYNRLMQQINAAAPGN
jgi:tetratricopeptide (TPR) repeat protein